MEYPLSVILSAVAFMVTFSAAREIVCAYARQKEMKDMTDWLRKVIDINIALAKDNEVLIIAVKSYKEKMQ